MRILLSGYHNPHYVTVTEYIERAIRSLGHELVIFNDRDHVFPGRLRKMLASWNFVASGLIFVTASMFQAMGNTIPSLITSFTRIVVVAIPAFLLSRLPGFEMRWIWYLSVVAVALQMGMNLLVLQREFRVRLTPNAGV